MFEIFPDQPVYEYPQLINIAYCFVWAFTLSSMLAITHRLTFIGENYPKNFFQSLILGSIVSAMVMMAIGDSLARGLGVFGAMAIIRFRTRIEDPRDVLFLFAALSTGLAIGVFGFTVAFTGTLIFCAIAFLLHHSPFRSSGFQSQLIFTLKESSHLPSIITIVQEYALVHRLVGVTATKESSIRYQYALTFLSEMEKRNLFEALHSKEEISQLKLTSNEVPNA